MSVIPSLKMNTGAVVPAIGLGCWAGNDPTDRENARSWFLSALKAGYRRFDTAYFYGTEKALGLAIKDSGVPREEIFVATKLAAHRVSDVEGALHESLRDLGLDYVDLYLIHSPQVLVNENNNPLPRDANGNVKVRHDYHFTHVWADMEKLYASGKVKAIGVSNMSIKNLDLLLKTAKVIPADNQVELHPYLVQENLVKYCQERGIMVSAYAPTGYANVRSDPVIAELAEKYNATPTQIVLACQHLARGVGVLPSSKDPKHQEENLVLPTLKPADVKRISALDKGMRLSLKPDEKGLVHGWTLEELGW